MQKMLNDEVDQKRVVDVLTISQVLRKCTEDLNMQMLAFHKAYYTPPLVRWKALVITAAASTDPVLQESFTRDIGALEKGSQTPMQKTKFTEMPAVKELLDKYTKSRTQYLKT